MEPAGYLQAGLIEPGHLGFGDTVVQDGEEVLESVDSHLFDAGRYCHIESLVDTVIQLAPALVYGAAESDEMESRPPRRPR